LYIRFPETSMTNPMNSMPIAPQRVFSHAFSPFELHVIISPTTQTTIVLVTSTIDLASALTLLVTVTPQMLKIAIVSTPKMHKNSRRPFTPTSLKYLLGLS